METWHYYRAGMVERGRKYDWRNGYSRVVENGNLYPWLTKTEARAEAKRHGAKAVFYDSKYEARKALGLPQY